MTKAQKRKALEQLNKAITIGSSPILYTQPTATAGDKARIKTLDLYLSLIFLFCCFKSSIEMSLNNLFYSYNFTAPIITANPYWGMTAVATPALPSEPVVLPMPAAPSQPPLPPPQPPVEPVSTKISTDKTKKLKKEKVG